jgi:hypothetical protein
MGRLSDLPDAELARLYAAAAMMTPAHFQDCYSVAMPLMLEIRQVWIARAGAWTSDVVTRCAACHGVGCAECDGTGRRLGRPGVGSVPRPSFGM